MQKAHRLLGSAREESAVVVHVGTNDIRKYSFEVLQEKFELLGRMLKDLKSTKTTVLFSWWTEVSSGVPQGQVLGLVLFNLFIHHLELEVSSVVAKSEGDPKLLRMLKTKAHCEELQENFSKLGEWAITQRTKFSVGWKRKLMHIGTENLNFTCTLMRSQLAKTERKCPWSCSGQFN